MRLQTAIPMDSFDGDDFGRDGERRRERRARRKARRQRRRRRKSRRLRRRARRVEERGGGRRRRGKKSHGRKERSAPKRFEPRATEERYDEGYSDEYEEPTLQPAPSGYDTWSQPAPDPYADPYADPYSDPYADPDVIDAEWAEGVAGVGSRLRRKGRAKRNMPVHHVTHAALPVRWSPLVKMGPHFRIQASQGYRAAVIEVKPGLFLVAELPEHVAQSEFGIAPLLAPLLVKAARKALHPKQGQQGQPGATHDAQGRPLQRLFHRQQGATHDAQGRPLQRLFHRQQGQPGATHDAQGNPLQRLFHRNGGVTHDAQGNPLQRLFHRGQAHDAQGRPLYRLLHPGQATHLQPAPGAGHGVRALLPPPELGRWADPEDVAELLSDELWIEPEGVDRG